MVKGGGGSSTAARGKDDIGLSQQPEAPQAVADSVTNPYGSVSPTATQANSHGSIGSTQAAVSSPAAQANPYGSIGSAQAAVSPDPAPATAPATTDSSFHISYKTNRSILRLAG